METSRESEFLVTRMRKVEDGQVKDFKISKKNIKLYQPSEILKGQIIQEFQDILEYFHLIIQSQEMPSSKKKRDVGNYCDYLGNSQNNSNLIKYV